MIITMMTSSGSRGALHSPGCLFSFISLPDNIESVARTQVSYWYHWAPNMWWPARGALEPCIHLNLYLDNIGLLFDTIDTIDQLREPWSLAFVFTTMIMLIKMMSSKSMIITMMTSSGSLGASPSPGCLFSPSPWEAQKPGEGDRSVSSSSSSSSSSLK